MLVSEFVEVKLNGKKIKHYEELGYILPKRKTRDGMRVPKNAIINDYVILSESNIIQGCNDLLVKHNLFLGASSGAAYVAAEKVLKKINNKNVNTVFISPDAGHAYLESIYNNDWLTKNNLI